MANKRLIIKKIKEDYIFPSGVPEAIAAAIDYLFKNGGAILASGKPGTGKTSIPLHFLEWGVAKQIVWGTYHAWTTDEDVFHRFNIKAFLEGNPDNLFVDGLLLKAAKTAESTNGPVWLLVDEIDKAPPQIDALFLNALEERVVVTPAGDLICRVPENLYFWFTTNETRRLSDALRRRVIGIEFPTLSGKVLSEFLRQGGLGEHTATTLASLHQDCEKAGYVVTQQELKIIGELSLDLSLDSIRHLYLVNGIEKATGRKAANDLYAAIMRDKKKDENID